MPIDSHAASKRRPGVILLAGPNGAGKSTVAPALLRGKLAVAQYVNADTIAQGLAGFAPESVALEAGRIMLARIHELAAQRTTFAFETTLASRSLAPWLRDRIATGYEFHLVFVCLPNADIAVARVADRVRLGGHDVPEETIRRRYRAGILNFSRLYCPLATTWRVYDNSMNNGMRLVARGAGNRTTQVRLPDVWRKFEQESRQ